MICPSKPFAASSPEHLVAEALEEIAAQEITVELIDPEEEARWNRLIRKRHYLKEHRLVGESLRYVAKQNGQWIALLGWSSAAFHLRPRDAWIGWTEGHGRHETREVYPFAIAPAQTGFPYSVQAAVIGRTTHPLKSVPVTEETEIVFSSRPASPMDAAQLQAFRRGHWRIESIH